jgi:hypothetical protein
MFSGFFYGFLYQLAANDHKEKGEQSGEQCPTVSLIPVCVIFLKFQKVLCNIFWLAQPDCE